MRKILIAVLVTIICLGIIRFVIGGDEDDWICENGDWVRHGNPSAPMPLSNCESEIETSISPSLKCSSPGGKTMELEEAKAISKEKCTDGELQTAFLCNANTGTWWIDFIPDQPKEGCNPACVVDIESSSAEVNWRCTGLILPSGQ